MSLTTRSLTGFLATQPLAGCQVTLITYDTTLATSGAEGHQAGPAMTRCRLYRTAWPTWRADCPRRPCALMIELLDLDVRLAGLEERDLVPLRVGLHHSPDHEHHLCQHVDLSRVLLGLPGLP